LLIKNWRLIFLGIAKKIPNTDQNVLGTTKKDFSHYINHSNDYTFVGSFEIFFG
jgi:hypothetical protein